ncbi:MAG: tRNA (N6-isopentenyl adenosine(37)-C2)-methylthiotransferase MiaB [Deltaproteobacteria bacterium]|nr:tRNA (N6-isopentenyl adenosine(37)-C2)-methylthiotransferase MiaB [Deltaproteobacteria bacterium]
MPGFSVTTFGCQMNQHDSERMEEVLRGGGATAVAADDADVVILNTCSVREKAEQKLRSEVGRWAKVKRERPDLLIVVAGCMAQQEGRSILAEMPSVDLVLGPDNIAELPGLLAELRMGSPPLVRTEFDLDAPRFLTAPTTLGERPTAFVTTMKGCNERCTFCVVPNTRGPERYRSSAELIAEIADLVSRGVREVTLLGQTVNSYRDPRGALPRAPEADPGDPDESEFAALLRAIAAEVPGLVRLRYTSPHPRHLTPSLIAAHRDLAIMPHHVHLPVQSGSDRMLKRMLRRYRRDEFLARVASLRAAVPEATISTDIIVGFPGETEADFEETLSLIEAVGFVGVFGFKYSVRPNTPAERLPDDVPEAEKSRRLARVFDVSERLVREHLAQQLGKTLRVLVEGPSKAREENATGRSERNEIVHIEDAARVRSRVGEVVEVTVVEAYKHSLLGRMTEAELARTPEGMPTRMRRALPLLGDKPSPGPRGEA